MFEVQVFIFCNIMSASYQENSGQHLDWRMRMRTIPHGDSDWPHWVRWVFFIPIMLLGGLLVFLVGGISFGMLFGVGIDEVASVMWLILGCGLNLGMGLIGAIWSKVFGVSSIMIRTGFFLFTLFAWFFLVSLLSGFIRWFL